MQRYKVGRGIKRIADLVIAGGILFAALPILLIVAGLIRFRMGAPVLFRQERAGLHGKPFTLYKFRTMTSACDEEGCFLPDKCRLTRVGAFLRRTSMDELPQLWNVIKGEMSLVGPRPLPLEYLPLYTVHQARRHEVLPGVVGLAGVNGRNRNSWETKFEMDVWYVDNRSLSLDLRILLRTIFIVIAGSGVNEEGCATASKFRGTAGDD